MLHCGARALVFSSTLLLFCLFGPSAEAATRVLRVRAGASSDSSTDGSSWDKAFPEIWHALEYINLNIGGGSAENPIEIWVTSGTYRPDIIVNGDYRYGTLALKSWTGLYGGFDGTESSRDQRDPANPLTILSGDVDFMAGGEPGHAAAAASTTLPDIDHVAFKDNVYNVVTAINAVGVRLDRLVITRGRAYRSATTDEQIEEMYLPDPSNLETSGVQRALERGVAGGGLYIENDSASTGTPNVTITDCVFVQNYARGFGAGIAAVRAKVEIRSSHFYSNLSRLDGGAYFGRDQNVVFYSTEFKGNHTQQSGGAVALESPVRVPGSWVNDTRSYYLGSDESRYQNIVGNSISMAKMSTTIVPDDLDGVAESLTRTKIQNARDEYQNSTTGRALNNAVTQDLAESGSNPYGVITKIVAAAKAGASVARATGSDDPITNFILDDFVPNFELYATPEGWSQLVAFEIQKSMGYSSITTGMMKDAFAFLATGGGAATFHDCRFVSNHAALDGAAIEAKRVDVVVQRSLFSENSAGNFATVNVAAFAKFDANNSIFSGNTAGRHSVVSLNQHIFSRLTNCTIVNNSSSHISGYAVAVETGSECRIINSILWGNTNANSVNAAGGADLFTARFSNLDPAMRQDYQSARSTYFRLIGLTEIANSDIQGISSLQQTWDRNNAELLTNPAFSGAGNAGGITFSNSGGGNNQMSPGEINLRFRMGIRDLAEEESAHDQWDVMIDGQGDRFLDRGNFAVDPQLHSSYYPRFGSPVLTGGSYNRQHSINSTAGHEDFLGAAWPRYPATVVGIGAISTPSLPTGVGGEVAGRYFVRPVATGDGSGRNWANATADLAATLAIPEAEVWVAAGTYYPSGTDDRSASFTLGANTQAYGGFNGTESTRNERNFTTHQTILSGLADGGSYHVVKHTNISSTAVLDGFTITNGQADGLAHTDNARGAGIFHDNSQVVLRNLKVQSNTATSQGGGFYSRNGATSTLTNVAFISNSAGAGGAIFTQDSIDGDRCEFTDNQAVEYGGAVMIELAQAASPMKRATFTNTVFQNNSLTSAGLGSALYLRHVDATLHNVTVYGNRAPENPNAGYLDTAVYVDSGSVDVRNSILYGNRNPELPAPSFPIERSQIYVPYENLNGTTAIYISNLIQGYRTTGGGGGAQRTAPNAVGNFDADPKFATNTVRPQADSPFIDRGTGDADAQRGADLAGEPRKVGSQIDPGAYEFQGTSQVLIGILSTVRTFNAEGPVYTLTFLADAPEGTIYTWYVNKNDGAGFVALPDDSRIEGQGTATLTITEPPAAWDGWSFRVDASGPASASFSTTLTGIGRNRIYVNGAVSTSGDGTTWATAFKTIPEAIAAAGFADYAQIWVAQGTYTPNRFGADAVFVLGPGRVLYGGFKGTETSQSQRNPTLYPTILSGYQAEAATISDHSSNVLLLTSSTTSALPIAVDGFTLRDASHSVLSLGREVEATVSNCVIENRFARGADLGSGSITFKHVTFRKNKTGAARVHSGTAVFEHTLFAQNEASSGAALNVSGTATVTIKNSTIADNFGNVRTGGVSVSGGSVAIENSILWNNRDTATELGKDLETAQLRRETGTLTITNSLVEKLSVFAGSGNLGEHPLFADPLNYNYTVAPQSPAIALDAGAFPYVGTPAATLRFAGMSLSTEERISLFSKSFSISWNSPETHSLSWQIDTGTGWTSAASAGLGAATSSNATSSTLTLNSGSVLPSLRVRAVTQTGVALPPILLKVIPPIIRYVRSDAPAGGNGLTWATAYRDPFEALAKVPSIGVEIWIARGTYDKNPSYDTRLIPGVALFGGFAGTETSLSQRALDSGNPTLIRWYFTISSGPLAVNGVRLENNLFSRQIALDGLKLDITSVTNGAVFQAEGGGGIIRKCDFVTQNGYAVRLRNSSATFENCTFTGGTSSAVVITGGNPIFRSCGFTGNSNQQAGGAITINTGAEVLIDRGLFTNNRSQASGGAIYNSGGLLTVLNSTFAGNHAERGGAIYDIGGLKMVNSTLTANTATTAGGGIYAQGAASIANTILWANRTPADIVASATEIERDQIDTYSGAVTIQNSIVEGLHAYTGNDNLPYDPLFSGSLGAPYTLTAASPAINRGVLTLLDELAPVAGYPGRLSGNTIDIGAYEFSGTPQTPVQLTSAPPASTSLYDGANATFTVAGAAGTGAGIVWERLVNGNWGALTTGGGTTISTNSTSSTLTLANIAASQAGTYRYRLPSIGFISANFGINVTSRRIVYVDQNVAASGNGATWGTAFKTIDAAMGLADPAIEVRVAAGNYTPGMLAIRPGFLFRGGYPATGSAAERNVRNPAAHLTRLNGTNILRADGTNKIYDDNTGFDGFTFTPTRSFSLSITRGSTLFFRNCVFADLPAQSTRSGAVYVDFGSNVRFEDCVFRHNRDVVITVEQNSSVRLVRAHAFENNRLLAAGYLGSVNVEDSIFEDNATPANAYLFDLNNTSSNLEQLPGPSVITRSRFTENSGALFLLWGPSEITDSLFHDNTAQLADIRFATVFRHLTIADNTVQRVNNASVPLIRHLDGEFELSNSILWNNRSAGSGDSIEIQQIKRNGGTFLVRNNLIEGFSTFGGFDNVSSAPLFAGQTPGAAEFYELLPQSPAVASGLASATTLFDLTGGSRGGTPDLGAIKFTGTAASPVTLTATPLSAPTALASSRSFTVAGPGAGANVQWWRWDGTHLVAIDDSRISIFTTATSSTLTIQDVAVSDTAGFVYTINGTSFRSGILHLLPTARAKIFVDPSRVRAHAADIGDGSSWEKAYLSFSTAYAFAPENSDLYLKAGTHSGGPYGASIGIRSGLRVYGGFTSTTQTDLAQRPATDGENTVLDNFSFTSTDAASSTLFDGVTFKRLNQTAVTLGGSAAPTFRHCVFTDVKNGVLTSAPKATFENCVFRNYTGIGLDIEAGVVTGTNLSFTGTGTALRAKAGSVSLAAVTFQDSDIAILPLIDVSGTAFVTLDRATIRDNRSGPISATGGSLIVRNSLLAGNIVTTQGIVNSAGGDVSILQSTIQGNVGSSGNGGLSLVSGALTVRNSILWANRGSQPGQLFTIEQQQLRHTAGTLTLDTNLIEDFASLGGSNNFSAEPFFSDPAGGDFSLTAISPAIDTGDTTLSQAGFSLDLADSARVAGAAPDLGAYEFTGTPASPLRIVRVPTSTEVLQNGTATFVAEASTGGGAAFTWQREVSPGVWETIANGGLYTITVEGNTSTLTVSPVTAAANHHQRFRYVHAGALAPSTPFTISVVNTRIIYVAGRFISGANGASWASGYETLAQAIANWDANAEIWVARTHEQILGTSFALAEGMRIYGGFNGNESRLDQRPIGTRTTLYRTNGDAVLDQTGAPVTRAAILDGFTLRGLTAGRVVYLPQASPTIRNCDFPHLYNRIGIETYQAAPLVENCTFSGGGPASNFKEVSSSSEIVGCSFSRNEQVVALQVNGNLAGEPTTISDTLFTANKGGSVQLSVGVMMFHRVRWTGNTTWSQTAALRMEAGTTAIVRNSLIADNWVTAYTAPGHSIVDNFGTLTVINVTIANNTVYNQAPINTPALGSALRNSGSVIVSNSILWDNRTTNLATPFTTEQMQLYPTDATSTVVMFSIVAGLSGYPDSQNVAYSPLFDTNYPGEYRLSRNSPAIDTGSSGSPAGSLDLLGSPRVVGHGIDRGAYEFSDESGAFSLGLRVETESAAIDGFVPISSSGGGELAVSGSSDVLDAIIWEVLIDGEWSPLPEGGDFTSNVSINRARLLIARPAGDFVPDRFVRFRVNGTDYISPTYTITSQRTNVRYVRTDGSASGDGLTWASAYDSLATAMAKAPGNTELWVAQGTYAGNAVTFRPTIRVYGGFAGHESARTARSTNRNLTIITHDISIPSDSSYPDDFAVIDGFRLLGNTTTFHRGASFKNVTFETGGGLRTPSAAPNLVLEDSLFLNNELALSAYLTDTATLTRVTFIGNERAINASAGTWSIADSTFDSSVIRTETVGAVPFLVSNAANVTVSRTNFLNAAGRVQAVSLSGGAARFTDCVFSGNKTTFNGPGVLMITGGIVDFDRCTFVDNRAEGEFAARASVMQITAGATVSLRNSYLAGNVTTAPLMPEPLNPDGTIAVFNATLHLTGVTLVNNTATAERLGGILLAGGSLHIANSILYGNTGAAPTIEQQQLRVSSGTVTLAHSLIEGLDTFTGTALMNFNPRFITENGRLTPGPDSPVRNAGDSTLLLADETDLLGNPRTRETAVDLGAIEPASATSTVAYDLGVSRRVPGGYLEITFDNTRNYTGLAWQIDTGAGWQTLSLPSSAFVTSGSSVILRLPWDDTYEGASIRLVGTTYTSPAYIVAFGTQPPTTGSVVTTTPATGATAASRKPSIAFTYDQAVGTNQLTPSSFVVHGSQHGRLNTAPKWGSVTNDLLAPTLTLGTTLNAGEIVLVSSTREIDSALGGDFSPYVSRFSIPWTSRPGAFRLGSALPTTGTIAGAAAADLNGDGFTDLLLAGENGAWIFLGDDDGGFTPLNFGAVGDWNAFATADFNGDGRIDFVGSRTSSSLTIETLNAAGDASTSLVSAPLAFAGSRLLPADFNGDGRQDILVLGPSSSDGEVLLLNNSDGTFTPAGDQRFAPAEDRTREAAIADFNRDGKLDFIQVRASSGDIVVWLNNGAGVFTADHSVRVAGTQTIALTDIDGDNWTDLVVAGGTSSDTLHIYRNDQAGHLVHQRSFAGGHVVQLAAADFDGDGDNDFLAITGTAPAKLWRNNGSGVFTAIPLAQTFPGAGAALQLAVADLNNDGAADVMLPQFASPLLWAPGNHFAGFTKTLLEATTLTFAESDFTAATTNYGGYVQDSFRVESLPAHGTLRVNGSAVSVGQYIVFGTGNTYTPTGHYYGSDSFKVAPADYLGRSPAGKVTLDIVRVVDAPDASTLTLTTFKNQDRAITLVATHPEKELITFSLDSPPTHGTAELDGDRVTYAPNSDYVGTDSFTYLASDAFGNHTPATVFVTVSDTTLTVTTAASSGEGSLAAAIATLDASGGIGRIVFAPQLAGQTLVFDTATDTVHGPSAVLVSNYLEIDGSAAPNLAIQRASSTVPLRFFRVLPDATLVLRNVKLVDGLAANESPTLPARGGAIYNEGRVILDGARFHENRAESLAATGSEGGAIYNDGGSLALLGTWFDDNEAVSGAGHSVFLRNGIAEFNLVSLFDQTSSQIHLLGDNAALTTTWIDTSLEGISSATIGAGTVAILDQNNIFYPVPAELTPSIDRIATHQLLDGQSIPLTVRSANATVSIATTDHYFFRGDTLPTLEIPESSGTHRTLTVGLAENTGGVIVVLLTATENGISYTGEFDLGFLTSVYLPPVASDQEIHLVDGALTAVDITATHPENEAVSYEILTPPAHGQLTGIAPNLTYDPQGYFGNDYLIYRATTPHGRSVTARVTFRSLESVRTITTADADGPGSLAAALDSTPALVGVIWDIKFAPELAGAVIDVPTRLLLSPQGRTAYRIVGEVRIDGSDAPGIRLRRSDTAPEMRLFNVASNGYLELRNLSLENGLAAGDSGQPGRGGAIYVESDDESSGFLLLDGVTLQDNIAFGGADAHGEGGAIYNDGGTLSVQPTASHFIDNAAVGGAGSSGRGGALYSRNGDLFFFTPFSEPPSTFSGNAANSDANLALVADGAVLSAAFQFTNVDHVGASALNDGLVEIDAGYTSLVTGPSLISVAPPGVLIAPSTLDVPLTLAGGVPTNISVSDIEHFSIHGSLAAPILRVDASTFPQTHSANLVLEADGYRFFRYVETAFLAYSTPTANDDQTVEVVMNQPKAFGLEASFNSNLAASYELLTDPFRMEEGMSVPGDAGTLTGTLPALTFTPPPQFTGTIRFAYRITDSANNSAIGIVTFNVANGFPTAELSFAEAQSSPLVGDLATTSIFAVGGHSTDDPITYALVSQPLHGSVTQVGDTNEFIYTAAPGYLWADHADEAPYFGYDVFTFKTIDSIGQESEPTEIWIYVADFASFQPPVITGVPPAPGELLPHATIRMEGNFIFSTISITDADSAELTLIFPEQLNGTLQPDANDPWEFDDHAPYGWDYKTVGSPEELTERLRRTNYMTFDWEAPPGTIFDASTMIIVMDDRSIVAESVPVRGLVENAAPNGNPNSRQISTPPGTAVSFQIAPTQAQGLPMTLVGPDIEVGVPNGSGDFDYSTVTDLSLYGTLTGPALPLVMQNGDSVTFTFTPDPDFDGVLVLSFPLLAELTSFDRYVTVFLAINLPPTGVDDTVSRGPNALSIPVASLLANDSDPDADKGDSVSFASVASTSANGVALSYASGTITYAASELIADDSFIYTLKDTYGATATATVHVLWQNNAPTPADDAFERTYGQPLTLTGGLLLANDSDPENDTITVSSVSSASAQGGTVTLLDGVITYTPPSESTLDDSFTYTITDARGASADATVTLTIANRAPIAADHTLTRYNDQSAQVATAELLALAADPDGDAVQLLQVDEYSVLGGDITHDAEAIAYTTQSPALVKDEDFFTYEIADTHGATSIGFITVQLLNRAPVATADSIHRFNNTEATTTITALLANDSDADGDELTIESIATTSAEGGTISVVGDTVTYTPPTSPFNASDSFTYTIKDAHNETATATVTIIVDNRTPTPVDDVVDRFNTEPAVIALDDLLTNDSDPDGDTLTFVSADATSAQGATITVADGTLTYTAASHDVISGDDTFTYKIKDTHNAEATATVAVRLVNRAPVPGTLVLERYNDQPATLTVATLLAAASDPDLDPIDFVAAAATSTQGADVVLDSGVLTYTAASPMAIVGNDTFTYTITDNRVETPITGTVTVKLINRAPTVEPVAIDRHNTDGTTLIPIATLLAAASDADGHSLTVAIVAASSSAGASVSIASEQVVYTPASLPLNTDDTFTFTIEDALGASTTGTVTLRVVNRVPIAGNDLLTRAAGENATVTTATLLGNDFDPDGDELTFVSVSATSAQGATVSLSDGVITYSPNGFITGNDTFTYTIRDSHHETATATVTVETSSAAAPILTIEPRTGGVTLHLTGARFVLHTIWVSTDLLTWTELDNVTTDTNGHATVEDPTNPDEGSARFYRADSN